MRGGYQCGSCVVVAIMRGGYQSGARSHGRQITKQLEVPNELIGTIIGRHGMKISEIRQAHTSLVSELIHFLALN